VARPVDDIHIGCKMAEDNSWADEVDAAEQTPVPEAVSAAPARPDTGGGVKLYIGNLSWETQTEDLLENFNMIAEVQDAEVVMERDTGRSRGFGFVTVADMETAQH